MTVLSVVQAEAYALLGGWPTNLAPIITAIMGPESGYDTQALNAPEQGIGLTQITPGSQADYDPLTNLKDAWAKFTAAGGQSDPTGAFTSQWSTYARGLYQPYLGAAQAALPAAEQLAASGQLGASTPAGGDSGSGVQLLSATNANQDIAQQFASIPQNIGHGLAGAASAGWSDLGIFAGKQIVALGVALVVIVILFVL